MQLLEFIIHGPPVSQQARRRERVREWIDAIRSEAGRYWPSNRPSSQGAVEVHLIYIFVGDAVDLDNLAKPFLDALKGLAFLDDRQVTDLIIRRRNLRLALRVENPSPLLASAIEQEKEFLYVAVRDAPEQEVVP